MIFSCSTTTKVSTEYSSADNRSEFNKFIEDFEKNYIYLKEKNELWKCIKETYSEKFSQITTKFEHILFYENLLNELYDNHIHLNTNTSQSYRLDAPLYVINSKGKTYYLHTKDVVLKGGRNQTIYYFAKDERSNSCDLPAGKKIVENEKTGLPFVKKA